LIIPDGDCAFKVRDEIVKWREGELLVFDTTNPHTAWNLTEHPRVILACDFYRPEEDRAKMVALERECVARVMATGSTFGLSAGMYGELDEETIKRYAVPRVEAKG
jgi:aspartyl/asparaginyl beta-hydroxylase (cupin superfamily)